MDITGNLQKIFYYLCDTFDRFSVYYDIGLF